MEATKEVTQLFDAWAKEKTYPHLSALEYQNVFRLSSLLSSPPKKVLDVGCGVGYVSQHLKKQGHYVIGLDLSEEALKIAKKENRIDEYIVSDTSAIPLPSESIDVVLFFGILMLVPDLEAPFEESYRILKKGGEVLVYDHHSRNPYTKLHFSRPKWADIWIDGRENVWRQPLNEAVIKSRGPKFVWKKAAYFSAFTIHPSFKINLVHTIARGIFSALRKFSQAPWTGNFIGCLGTKET